MKTALYTVALGAALLLTGVGSAGEQEGLFTSERDCTSTQFLVCGHCAGRRTHSCLYAVPCR